jgi:hypothetical protein
LKIRDTTRKASGSSIKKFALPIKSQDEVRGTWGDGETIKMMGKKGDSVMGR